MGYVADYFSVEVGRWLREGWLAPGLRLIDFGDQEFYCDQDEARRNAEAFLRGRKVPQERIAAALGSSGKVSIAAIYQALGIDYCSVDVDDKNGATYFDLNAFAPPMAWRSVFDFVNNEGTIEHLINPINGFQVAHELLKVGGVARHSIPVTGWSQHGLMYPTVKFYEQMLEQNRYDPLRMNIFIRQSDSDFAGPSFRMLSEDGEPLTIGVKATDAWLSLVYRKTTPAEFRVPFDHLLVADSEALGERVSGAFSGYSRTRLTGGKGRDPIGDAFERRIELIRRRSEFARRNLALLVPLLAIMLNGAALALTAGAPASQSRIAFALGLVLAFVPTALVWRQAPLQTGTNARIAPLATRLAWLGSAAAFIYGCLI